LERSGCSERRALAGRRPWNLLPIRRTKPSELSGRSVSGSIETRSLERETGPKKVHRPPKISGVTVRLGNEASSPPRSRGYAGKHIERQTARARKVLPHGIDLRVYSAGPSVVDEFGCKPSIWPSNHIARTTAPTPAGVPVIDHVTRLQVIELRQMGG